MMGTHNLRAKKSHHTANAVNAANWHQWWWGPIMSSAKMSPCSRLSKYSELASVVVGAHNLSAKRSPHSKCSKLASVVMGIHNLSAIRLPCSEHSELASIVNAVNAANSHHWWWGPKTWAQKSRHTSNFSHAANLAMQWTQQMLWGSKFLRGTFSYLNIDGVAPHHHHHLLCMWRTHGAKPRATSVYFLHNMILFLVIHNIIQPTHLDSDPSSGSSYRQCK